ncbi:DUF5794 domain-containing protein [Halomarina oriensis]|uniref:Uncharacterized protein n=1 Tax=Halomarina oriensis TaxID=671145 RepID=A0A6B0GQR7_9EURY|nr:DUF5794 domain-containing protein [Halomarina oriensis]MWG34008.1 hypothetical protein [Halomarina oriensis]
MSTSRHPIALRLERQVGRGTKLLGTVMGLPLVDGIFAALVLAGALTTAEGGINPVGVFEVGLLVFGGSATLAVILAEMEGTTRQRITSVLLVGALVVPLAAAEAAIAPTIEAAISIDIFNRFAALVILAIAAKTASSTVGEWLPRPGAIIGLGLIASLTPAGATLVVDPDPTQMLAAAAAAGVGVAFALLVAVAGPTLRGLVDLDRFRFGSAVALGVLPLTLLQVIDTDVPLALAVLGVTCLLSLDPDSSDIEFGFGESATTSSDGGPSTPRPAPAPEDDAPSTAHRDAAADPEARGANAGGPATDGGPDPEGGDDPGRAPWL